MILNILEFYENHPERPVAMVFLDAQKAFNNLDWNFMIEQLRGMGAVYKSNSDHLHEAKSNN